MPNLKVVLDHPDAKPPTRATEGSAGYDLYSVEDVILRSNDNTKMVSTGIKIRLPPGHEAQVRCRSGLALKGIRVANSPGTVDEDFSGVVKVLVQYVHSDPPTFTISKGDRIAQMVIEKYEVLPVELVDSLDQTARGEGGFGSSGR
jgi:deoxyuridine 5'-triphosphate nucleotidohydrolase